MPMKSSDVAKWIAGEWPLKVKFAKPSGGGAVGVMFCWCRTPGSDGANYKDPSTSDFVLKPVAGSAAPAKFAESFMQSAMGAKSVNTKAVLRTETQKFNAVIQTLNKFKTDLEKSEAYEQQQLQQQPIAFKSNVKGNVDYGVIRGARSAQKASYSMSEADHKTLARWREVWAHYQNAGALLIQELALDQVELADVYKDNSKPEGIRDFLKNQTLMVNLGRLFAVDAALGNGDRLASPNPGNILYSSKNEIWAIDSQTILQNHEAIKTAANHHFLQFADNRPDSYPQAFHEGVFGQVPANSQLGNITVTLAPDFAMKHFYDVDGWFKNWFRVMLESKISNSSQTPPSESEWAQALLWFKQGVDTGLKEVDAQLSGFNWLSVKSKFKKYESKYGADPNMDWTNFKMRRVFIKALRAYPTQPDKAWAAVQAYAKKKLPVDNKV